MASFDHSCQACVPVPNLLSALIMRMQTAIYGASLSAGFTLFESYLSDGGYDNASYRVSQDY
ncbi:hypothetical protein [Azospirillum sp. B510]|uniref:hypothetical protein n=1 Tax=Azospirillum sp. (strain B510) TaxID=137722 RepID=UPI0013053391|nr:hypothetical protein [Azospirillum sp. B510]